MKTVKRISLWALLALSLEFIGFGYLDKYYLVDDTSFKATTKVVISTTPKTPKEEKQKIEIKLPEDIDIQYRISDSGKYLSYREGNNIKVVNTSDGTASDIVSGPNETVSYYRWVPETDIILLVKKMNDQRKFKLFRYNVKFKDKLEEIRDYMDGSMDGQEVAIPIRSPKAEITDIDISIFNFVTYIKVINNVRNYEIYRMDRMSRMERLNVYDLKSQMIGKIFSTKHAERMVYEDKVTNKILGTGIRNPIMPRDVKQAALLGIDSKDDTIYIGAVENGRIVRIYCGLAETPVDAWKVMVPEKPAYKEDIYVATGGKVYINNNLEGEVTELESGEKTYYDGRILVMYDKGIVTQKQSILQKLDYYKNVIQ